MLQQQDEPTTKRRYVLIALLIVLDVGTLVISWQFFLSGFIMAQSAWPTIAQGVFVIPLVVSILIIRASQASFLRYLGIGLMGITVCSWVFVITVMHSFRLF